MTLNTRTQAVIGRADTFTSHGRLTTQVAEVVTYVTRFGIFPRPRPALALLVALATCSTTGVLRAAESPTQRFDVVIVSGSSSGVGAALGAARLGVSVALIEDTPVLGGMLANGIGNTDSYSVEALSGVFREFTDRVKEHYQPNVATDPLFKLHIRRYLPPALLHTRTNLVKYPGILTTSGIMDPDEGGRWEMKIADKIFKEMVAAMPNIKVFYRRHATRVIKEGDRVTGVETYAATKPYAYAPSEPGSGIIFYGEVIIDATHEGDIAAWAGVPYRVGREARSRLEPHAGSIYFYDGTGEILPGSTGQQDRGVMSYGHRLFLQNYDEKEFPAHLLATPPPDYDKAAYEHSAFGGNPYNPNGKVEMNMYPFGNELQEINWTWAEASRAERERQYMMLKNHALGFLYYLQHEQGKRLGLPADEFTDNGNVPYRVYVRVARRIVGDYTMTEADINPYITGRGLIQPIKSDAIAVGHYPLDAKPSYLKTELSMPDKGNGDFYINATQPFQVPYGSILPKAVEGLLVPTAISATHVAFAAIRLDPCWTVMGQAAGVAAALSVKGHVSVRTVAVNQIQRELLKQKCKLMFYWDLPGDHPAFPAVQWLSVRHVVTGYPDRLFRPDQALTRAEMALLVVNGLDLWPSVSNAHFTDVPTDFWAFREIETLFDNQTLQTFGLKPLWPDYGSWDRKASKNVSYDQEFGFVPFHPAQPVTWKELVAVIGAVQQRRTMSPVKEGESSVPPAPSEPMGWVREALARSMFGTRYAQQPLEAGAVVTRGQACALIAALTDPAVTTERKDH